MESTYISSQAGLLAAALSAFLVYTIPQLQSNSTDISKDILLHISLQLSNSSVPAYVEPPSFVTTNAAVVNTLLFTSLALVVVDAYLAVLIRGWLREFDRSWRNVNTPEQRARAREMRFQALKQYRLPEVVALLPLLIQASLLLFGVALVIMLFDLYRPTAYTTFAILLVGVLFYFSTMVVSAFDTNAPFTSPFSRALQVLINTPQLRRLFFVALSRLKWSPGPAKDVKAETQLAIYNRLYNTTSKAVENLPVFAALLDQWVHTPSLRPRSMAHWSPVLPLIQPYLSNTSLSKDFGLRSVARLLLCFKLREPKGQQALVEALREGDRIPAEQHSIEQLYIHLLHQPDPEWSPTCQQILKLKADSDTIIELRWILIWIRLRFLDQSEEFPNIRESSWVFSVRNIIPFLRSIAVYIIQNQIVNDDHMLFDLLLRITRLLADAFNEVDTPDPDMGSTETQTSSDEIDGELFVSIGDFHVPVESRWEFIRDLYATSSTSAAGFNRDFTLLIITLMIGTLSAVEDSHLASSITYDPFLNLPKDLPILMDGLWEIWQVNGVDHYSLTGIATWLLNKSGGSFRKPSYNEQQSSFQNLLNAYDSYTSDVTPPMTSSAHQFIGAALSFSLSLFNLGIIWQPKTLELKNPWLVMHIHNILRCDWRIPGSEMREAVWGELKRPNVPGQIEPPDLLDHEADHIDHILNHLLDQQFDQQIKTLLDQHVREIRQDRELRQVVRALQQRCEQTQQLQQEPQEPLQLLQQQRQRQRQQWQQQQQQQQRQQWQQQQQQQQRQRRQLLEQLQQQWQQLSVQLLHLHSEPLQQLQKLQKQLQQLFSPFRQLPTLEQKSQLLIQKLMQMIKLPEHGFVDVFTQELQQKELHQVFQEFIQEYLRLPPLNPPPDPPLPPINPQLDPPRLRVDPLPPLPYLERLLPSSPLEPLLSRIPRHFPLFPLLVQLDQQLGEFDQIFKPRDYQIFKQREEQINGLRYQWMLCSLRWVQQQRSDQELDQEPDQELDLRSAQQEELIKWLKFGQLKQQRRQPNPQHSTVLDLIARQRLELYDAKELHPDPVALSLFLFSSNEEISNSSRRIALEIFRSTPKLTILNTTEGEEETSSATRLQCSDFFGSKAIGDLTKWRLLASVVFPEWETILPQWKDHLVEEVMKVDRVDNRVDWMARVTPLLEGRFNLCGFGLSDYDTWGYLTRVHLRMVAVVVEHIGSKKRLVPEEVRELEAFLEQYSNILDDNEALDRIRAVTKSHLH